MTTKIKVKATTRDLILEAAEWPSQRDLARDYGVPERFVCSLVNRGLVESIRLNTIRVNPASFEAYIESTHNQP
jgi:hypothetical protein